MFYGAVTALFWLVLYWCPGGLLGQVNKSPDVNKLHHVGHMLGHVFSDRQEVIWAEII